MRWVSALWGALPGDLSFWRRMRKRVSPELWLYLCTGRTSNAPKKGDYRRLSERLWKTTRPDCTLHSFHSPFILFVSSCCMANTIRKACVSWVMYGRAMETWLHPGKGQGMLVIRTPVFHSSERSPLLDWSESMTLLKIGFCIISVLLSMAHTCAGLREIFFFFLPF